MKMIGRCSMLMLCGVALLAGVGWGAEEKIAVVNSTRALKEFKKTKLADARMEEQVAEFNAERDKMLAEHAKLKAELEAARSDAQNKALSDKALNEKRDKAEDKLLQVIEYENKIRDTALERRKQIEEESVRIHKRLVSEITDAISKYAAREGVTLVLDSAGMTTSGFSAVIYNAPRMDITDAVIAELNKVELNTDEFGTLAPMTNNAENAAPKAVAPKAVDKL